MKKLLFLLLMAGSLFAQDAQIRRFTGAPSGGCNSLMIAVNQSNGDFYTCYQVLGSGVWIKVGSSAPFGAAGGDLTGTYPNPTLASTISGAKTFSTSIAIGTAVPSARLDVQETDTSSTLTSNAVFTFNSNNSSGTRSSATGSLSKVVQSGAGLATTLVGNYGSAQQTAGTVTRLEAVAGAAYLQGGTANNVSSIVGVSLPTAGTGTDVSVLRSEGVQNSGAAISNAYGLLIDSNLNTSGTIGTNYGIKIGDQSIGAITNYALHSGSGLVSFGDSTTIAAPTTGSYYFRVTNPAGGDRMRIYNGAAGIGMGIESTNNAEGAYAPLYIDSSRTTFDIGNVGFGASAPASPLSVGGTTGNFQVSSAGLLPAIGGITTVSNTVPAIYGTVDLTAQNAIAGPTTIYTTPAAIGQYRVSYTLLTKTAGNAVNLALVIGWTTPDDSSTVQSRTSSNVAINTVGANTQDVFTILCKASTTITWQTTLSGAIGTGTFDVFVKVEKL